MPLISYSWQFMLDQAFVDLASVRSVTSAILSFKEDSVQIRTYFCSTVHIVLVLKIKCQYFIADICFVSFQSTIYRSKVYTI
jgi:hypothetical protein